MLACRVPAATLGDARQVIFWHESQRASVMTLLDLACLVTVFLVELLGGRCGGSKGRRRLHGRDDGVLGASAVGGEGLLEILQAQPLDDTGTHRVA